MHIVILIILLLLTSCQQNQTIHYDQSMFVWDLELIDEIHLEQLESQGFNKLFIYCSESKMAAFEEKLALCDPEIFQVYALNGSYEWIDDEEALNEFMTLVDSIDRSLYPQFQGLILDIEPYLLKKFDPDEDYYIYQDLLNQAILFCRENDLSLNVVIPFWYDGIKEIDLEGHDDLADWIISMADETTIMAYRNKAEGGNGILSLIEEEVNHSLISGHPITVALETRPSSEGDHLSFSEMDKEAVIEMIVFLATELVREEQQINFAVHDLESWLELE